MPGTEVAVAPKRRKKPGELDKDSSMLSSTKSQNSRAMLRIQEADNNILIHKSKVESVELSVVLTSVAIVHPETAKELGLNSLQVVAIVPRMISNESGKDSGKDGLGAKNNLTTKGSNNIGTKESRHVIVQLLFSDSVAKGHVMIAESLRLYLRAALHSCMFSSPCSNDIIFVVTLFYVAVG